MSAVVDVAMTTHTKKILGGLLLVCVMAVIGFMLLFNINTQSISKDSQTVLFNVNEGDTMSAVIDRLADEGIVRSSFFTKIKAKLEIMINFMKGSLTSIKVGMWNAFLSILSNLLMSMIRQVQ
ncbi:MltG/YceG/YrrL family protein [Erysipelothrix piscisicarius]|uniref:hypothetical protein n=1 Tax=Erysipelothrix piscisicarius TaxID=2485784 RepID=UPI001E4375A1|nr:hypothetical protein [Erysipelothrix piscisicarius]